MDTSISADESEWFEAPSDINASPRIEASIESPIPAESRSASKIKGRYIVPKAPKKVRDKAQEALTAALDQVPEQIHFDQRGKRTTATLYVGNLEFKASTKDLQDALNAEFDQIRVEDVVIPRKDSRSRGHAFITLSWAQASKVNPSDICTFYLGWCTSSHDRNKFRPKNFDDKKFWISKILKNFEFQKLWIFLKNALEAQRLW